MRCTILYLTLKIPAQVIGYFSLTVRDFVIVKLACTSYPYSKTKTELNVTEILIVRETMNLVVVLNVQPQTS